MRKVIVLLLTIMFVMKVNAKEETVIIKGAVGHLKAIILKPEQAENEKMPMAIICHGFTSHKNDPLLKAVADSLSQHGIGSIRFDFNGHGESEGAFQNMTVLNEIEDAKLVYEYTRELPYVGDIFIVGHSQGGVVASMVAGELGEDNIKGEVLISAAVVLRDNLLQGMVFGSTFNPINPPEYVPIFNGLKLGKAYIETGQKLPILETAKKYTGSAFIIHGTNDNIVPYTYSQRLNDYIRYSRLKMIDGADHVYSRKQDLLAHYVVDYLLKLCK